MTSETFAEGGRVPLGTHRCTVCGSIWSAAPPFNNLGHLVQAIEPPRRCGGAIVFTPYDSYIGGYWDARRADASGPMRLIDLGPRRRRARRPRALAIVTLLLAGSLVAAAVQIGGAA